MTGKGGKWAIIGDGSSETVFRTSFPVDRLSFPSTWSSDTRPDFPMGVMLRGSVEGLMLSSFVHDLALDKESTIVRSSLEECELMHLGSFNSFRLDLFDRSMEEDLFRSTVFSLIRNDRRLEADLASGIWVARATFLLFSGGGSPLNSGLKAFLFAPLEVLVFACSRKFISALQSL